MIFPPRDSTQFDTVVPRNSLHPRRLKISPLSPADQPASRDILSLPSIGGKEKNRIARCESPIDAHSWFPAAHANASPYYVRTCNVRARRASSRTCVCPYACVPRVRERVHIARMHARSNARTYDAAPRCVCNVGLRERVRVAWFHENARV